MEDSLIRKQSMDVQQKLNLDKKLVTGKQILYWTIEENLTL